MNNKKLITKIVILAGYLMFAGFSALFTAESVWLNLLRGSSEWTMWIVFVLVLFVAALAGTFLNNAIKQMKNHINPSRSAFVWYLLGFLLLWTVSFTTNVHYFFVEKHGFSILSKELISAKRYIEENTSKTNQAIDRQKEEAMMAVKARVTTNAEAFGRELGNTIPNHIGFGDVCINILKSTEHLLAEDSKIYNDKNTYTIFEEKTDAGDKGVKGRDNLNYLYEKYSGKMLVQLNKKLAVIEKFYENKKDQNAELIELLDPIAELETKHLPEVEKDNTVGALYRYASIQDSRVISKMPKDYSDKCVVKSGGKIKKYNTYPSQRMFDTLSVWGDILGGMLEGMSMLQWILISLIIDIVSFILFIKL